MGEGKGFPLEMLHVQELWISRFTAAPPLLDSRYFKACQFLELATLLTPVVLAVGEGRVMARKMLSIFQTQFLLTVSHS